MCACVWFAFHNTWHPPNNSRAHIRRSDRIWYEPRTTCAFALPPPPKPRARLFAKLALTRPNNTRARTHAHNLNNLNIVTCMRVRARLFGCLAARDADADACRMQRLDSGLRTPPAAIETSARRTRARRINSFNTSAGAHARFSHALSYGPISSAQLRCVRAHGPPGRRT